MNLSVLIGTRTGGNSFCVSSSCQSNNNLKLFEPLLAYGTLIRSTRFFLTFVFMYIYRHLVHGVFALDAYIALYPLVLILASYILIELYDRNVWCIVFVWKPLHLFFRRFRDNWDIRTSVIDSFATFFLLSYVKILSTTIDLMLTTHVHKLHSNKTLSIDYYAGNIEFLHGDHIIARSTFNLMNSVLFKPLP